MSMQPEPSSHEGLLTACVVSQGFSAPRVEYLLSKSSWGSGVLYNLLMVFIKLTLIEGINGTFRGKKYPPG